MLCKQDSRVGSPEEVDLFDHRMAPCISLRFFNMQKKPLPVLAKLQPICLLKTFVLTMELPVVSFVISDP